MKLTGKQSHKHSLLPLYVLPVPPSSEMFIQSGCDNDTSRTFRFSVNDTQHIKAANPPIEEAGSSK